MYATHAIDLDRLLRLRVAVARHGEMDRAKWWNTQGMLGPNGVTVLSRNYPRTHWFAQARVVFAVARSRCHELFDPPGCMTLWSLPAPLEDAFEARWPEWLDCAAEWAPFFEILAQASGASTLPETLRSVDLLSPEDEAAIDGLHRSGDGRAVMLPGAHEPSDAVLTQLAAGFALGGLGAPVIPYARLDAA